MSLRLITYGDDSAAARHAISAQLHAYLSSDGGWRATPNKAICALETSLIVALG